MADRLRHFIDLRGENQANTCTNKLHKTNSETETGSVSSESVSM